MNLLLLLAGFRIWSGSPAEIVTRVFGALSLFALEMQLATWTGVMTRGTLVPVNLVAAAALLVWTRPAPAPQDSDRGAAPRTWQAAWAGVAIVVAVLAVRLPLEAADPYHLERMQRIQQMGTLAYDPAAHPKVNVLGWLYEASLADLAAIPVVGPVLLRGHGLLGLALYALTARATFQILHGAVPPAGWLVAVLPVVFHQFVMVKNDLFGAIPASLVLAWVVARTAETRVTVNAWAGWLAGLAIGVKLTSFPLAVVFGAATLWPPPGLAARLAASALGTAVGLVAAGLLFVLVENVAVYGDAVAPFAALGNRTSGIGDAAVSVGRFALSLLDMGLVTRDVWPGRGGWAGTYGLPLVWALSVLLAAWRTDLARRTLAACGLYWLLFAAVYPDADVAHRLALAPGLVAVAAASVLAAGDMVPAWLRRLAPVVGILSAVQILRSAFLYLVR